MVLVGACLIVGSVWIGAESLRVQTTSRHYQWIHHKEAIILALSILAGFALQEMIWRIMERNQLTREATSEPKPKLRWYQYRLAHLFIFVTICAVGCSWFACRMQKAKRQREAVAAIEEMDCHVMYDYECAGYPRHPGPLWLRDLAGVDFVADVVAANWAAPHSRFPLTDADLEHLQGLTSLKSLHLYGRPIGDTGLEHLQGLANLESLNLGGTQVSDAGLEHLHGLTKLEWLWVNRTQVSKDGVERLKQALPKCEIYYSPDTARREPFPVIRRHGGP